MALEDRNLLEVSKRAGVSYSALRKIAAGNDNISLRTANRLSSYLFGVKYEARPTH
jgi:transcriptional regulator with XRE-family HTH domain